MCVCVCACTERVKSIITVNSEAPDDVLRFYTFGH